MYFQPKRQDPVETKVMIEILENWMYDGAFKTLRTEENLGYKIVCCKSSNADIHGLTICIQSAKYSPKFLQERVLNFVDQFFQHTLKKEDFEVQKESLLQTKENPFESLEDEHTYNLECLTEFASDPDRFIRWKKLAEEINFIKEGLQYENFRDFYKELFQPRE